MGRHEEQKKRWQSLHNFFLLKKVNAISHVSHDTTLLFGMLFSPDVVGVWFTGGTTDNRFIDREAVWPSEASADERLVGKTWLVQAKEL